MEEMRLQLAVDQLVADGVLAPSTAFEADSGLERVLGERGLLGLDLEALRREARQQRRQALLHQRRAVAQRQIAASQWARAVTRLDPFGPPRTRQRDRHPVRRALDDRG
jgi:hypothetical protein